MEPGSEPCSVGAKGQVLSCDISVSQSRKYPSLPPGLCRVLEVKVPQHRVEADMSLEAPFNQGHTSKSHPGVGEETVLSQTPLHLPGVP